MPVHNSNSKISALPDLATQLLQILISTKFDSLLSERAIYTLAMFQKMICNTVLASRASG